MSPRAFEPMLSAFLVIMRAKLSLPKNVAKGDWRNDSDGALFERAEQELAELGRLLIDNPLNSGEICKEAADVANFVAMIADNHDLQRIALGHPNAGHVCHCPRQPECVPHGWSGVSVELHAGICASHDHVIQVSPAEMDAIRVGGDAPVAADAGMKASMVETSRALLEGADHNAVDQTAKGKG